MFVAILASTALTTHKYRSLNALNACKEKPDDEVRKRALQFKWNRYGMEMKGGRLQRGRKDARTG